MKYLFILMTLILNIGVVQSQTSIAGKWKISALKILTLNEDNSFVLKKGAFIHEGDYEIIASHEADNLILVFPTITKSYEIRELAPTTMTLFDKEKKQTFNCTLLSRNIEIETIEQEEKLVRSEDDPDNDIQNSHIEKSKEPTIKMKSYSEINDHRFFFSINANGKANFARGEGAKDTVGIIGENTDYVLKFSPLYSYTAGVKLGYKLVDKIYLGSGASYSIDGYNVKQKSVYHDSIYQYDATSTQTAKYSITTIEIPLWVDLRFYNSWNIAFGGYVGIHLNNTSKVDFTDQNDVIIDGKPNDLRSSPYHEYQELYPSLSEKYSYGYNVTLHKYWGSRFSTSISYQRGIKYTAFGGKDIINEAISFGLNLRLI